MDWDNDGKKDLVMGEGAGYLRVYINTNTDADPQFNGYSNVKVSGVNKDFGDYSTPFIIDWDEDGKKDLLVGDNLGYVNLLLNTGTDASPTFTSSNRVMNAGAYLKVNSRSCPVAFDWDVDGKKDLLVGSGPGNIQFYQNQGTDAAPVFDGNAPLEVGGSNLDCGQNACHDLADWTNDGMVDIIAGCYNYGGSPLAPVMYYRALFLPAPDALVNGQDGPISVPASTPLTFKIALDPGSLDGVACDWWVWVEKGYFTKWWCEYNGGNKTWTKNATPIRFAGAPLQVVNGYTVLAGKTIPAGLYYFRFAIDEKNDSYEGTYLDEVQITTY